MEDDLNCRQPSIHQYISPSRLLYSMGARGNLKDLRSDEMANKKRHLSNGKRVFLSARCFFLEYTTVYKAVETMGHIFFIRYYTVAPISNDSCNALNRPYYLLSRIYLFIESIARLKNASIRIKEHATVEKVIYIYKKKGDIKTELIST